MALNADLLRSSFQLVIEREPNLTRRFYEILFDRYPEARALFTRHSPARQEQMLAEALAAVIDHLDDGPWLESTLEGLGAKHHDYGVTDEMYDWVGASLLATLSEVAGEDWTPELSRQWEQAYGAIASMMQSGAHRVAS